jgi:ABC-2 type transport system ATP-binding protein
LLTAVEGKVWEWTVPSADLPAVRQGHLVSSAIHRSDGVHIRMVANASPGTGATKASPTLEDSYLYEISQAGKTVA